ncbi:hypothetical protein [Entomomonas asaccharolytica]|uniref:Uncharacterized protein n=1 Tax=Entomomonas asaccharolytica TaxID=2785331 RepID=A0A974RY59_9GAMM|nr:hypothetical protein [Entomomonas asaccharolytica]QQP86958.1 hypothetical protein JHT90_06850 [Entomomonas asaccharolytica]
MKRFLLSFFLCIWAVSVSANNECKITSIYPKINNNQFTFKNRLAHDLTIYSNIPKSTIVGGDPILVFKDKNTLGFQLINESFSDQEDILKTLQDKWNTDCNNKIYQITKNNYLILITKENNPLTDKESFTAYILPQKNKGNSYFYLVSFRGFTENQVIQMLIKE